MRDQTCGVASFALTEVRVKIKGNSSLMSTSAGWRLVLAIGDTQLARAMAGMRQSLGSNNPPPTIHRIRVLKWGGCSSKNELAELSDLRTRRSAAGEQTMSQVRRRSEVDIR